MAYLQSITMLVIWAGSSTDHARPPLPAALDCRGIGRPLCQIESRIKKTPEFRPEVFLYANKSGARGVGGWGKRPTRWLLWASDYSESV
jgi:hypothetical protein